ncbi:MAG: mercuric reductase [Nitrospirae bacterium]|nr:mercuric reductase [Nitrospirota bacterium]
MNGPASEEGYGKIVPADEFNRLLIDHVHPPGWINPEPKGKYNLAVIGAGTAGLVAAAIASALGAKVALIERHLMGGDCLNFGCVPSKSLLRASRALADLKKSGEFGVQIEGEVTFHFETAMARMRKLRAGISGVDSARRYQKMGVDVFLGEGAFTSSDTIDVAGGRLKFSRAVICTGARAALPEIPGLKEAEVLTNETLFSLERLPERMAVIGGGPIGCELAQAFALFGTGVSLFESAPRILLREDADAAQIVYERMKKEGVSFLFHSDIRRVSVRGGQKVLHYVHNGVEQEKAVDEILVSAGRSPNVEGLGLENTGVEYDPKNGIRVNNRLQTANPKIYAAGDVCSPFKFTHVADAQAQIVIQNALFPHPFGLGVATTGSLNIPWCTYTRPEIAHVGLYEAEARQKGIVTETFTWPLKEVDRAVLDGETEGFARIHVRKGTDQILGATAVAKDAGDLISGLTLAMKSGAGLRLVAGTIFPYPTRAEVIKKAANAWRKTTLTESKKSLLAKWFWWTR